MQFYIYIKWLPWQYISFSVSNKLIKILFFFKKYIYIFKPCNSNLYIALDLNSTYTLLNYQCVNKPHLTLNILNLLNGPFIKCPISILRISR